MLGWSDAVPWWGLLNSASTLKLPHTPGLQKKQLRGPDADEARKYRITLELRQLLRNYCSADPAVRPTGHMGRSLLIVGGKHARLSNISAAGRWIADEVFWVAGERVHHKKNRHVGRTLEEWRAIRDNPKTAHLLQRVEVMAQPAAVTDSVIFTWVAESQAAEFGACLWTRDTCGGAGGGEACKTAMFCAGQIPNYIAAKMTAVLQPTDTDFAFPPEEVR